MNQFQVGQRVICIRRDDWYSPMYPDYYPSLTPVFRKTYTIRTLVFNDKYQHLYLRLNEVVLLDEGYGFGEVAWTSGAFRPVQERKTSIEVFEKLLLTKPNKILQSTPT